MSRPCEGGSDLALARYADLVAIGTIADVMPLTDENRYLVRLGLEQIVRCPRPGIAAMLRESSIDPARLTASTIGFSLAPRLNAAGRLGRASIAAKLILSRDEATAVSLARELCELNRKRQSIENEIWKEANAQLQGITPDGPIVLASESWNQGVIGIAASRLAEQYSLPAIIVCLNGDVGKGSCRSYGGFNLFEALSACADELIGFGGHALAAGLNVRREKLDDFRKALRAYYIENKPEPKPEVQCDLLITDPALLSLDNVRSLDLLEPYGNANPKPVMCISGARLEAMSEVGSGKHTRLRIRMGSAHFECIFFSHSAADTGVREGDLIDLAFTPQINEYRGLRSVQLNVMDIRPGATCRREVLDQRELYQRFAQTGAFSPDDAARLLPVRSEFVAIWRYLIANSQDNRIQEEFTCMARKIVRATGMPLTMGRTRICLDVFAEQGLIRLHHYAKYDEIEITTDGRKVDLDSSPIIRSLRRRRGEKE